MKRLTLREARKRRGLTQEQLAHRAGVDQTTISSLEVGRKRNPTFDTVVKLARALGREPGELRFGVHEEAMPS